LGFDIADVVSFNTKYFLEGGLKMVDCCLIFLFFENFSPKGKSGQLLVVYVSTTIKYKSVVKILQWEE